MLFTFDTGLAVLPRDLEPILAWTVMTFDVSLFFKGGKC